MLTIFAAIAAIYAFTAAGAAGASPVPGPEPLAAKTTKILAEADATVRQDQASTNLGWTSTLDAMVGPDRRGYLRFDVSGLTRPVQKATLSLTVAKGGGSAVQVRAVSDTGWGEGAITWSNAPAPGAVIASPAMPSAGRVSIDVTSAVSGNGKLALALVSQADRTTVYSREAGPSNGPELSVTTWDAASPPVNAGLPALSGTAQSGQTLSTTNGSWSGTTPMSFSYQWLRCDGVGGNCIVAGGAVSVAYPLGSADVGFTLRARVTATNSAGSASATSAPSTVVQPPPPPTSPLNTALPAISGTAQQGQTLSSSNGGWSGTTPMSFSYQWLRCDSAGGSCTNVVGANSQSYVLGSADLGRTVRSRVKATNAAGSASATSPQSAVVQAPPPSPPGGGSDRFGISGMTWTLAAEPDSDFKKDMSVIDGSGADWLRIDINWAMVQRDGPTFYDWAPFDRIITNARSRGLNVLGIIDYTPAWARPSPTADAWTPPKKPADFGKFAADVARRYGPLGVRAYEIWNEPNLGSNWKPAADAAGYTQLLKAAYTALKGVDPSIIVVGGGLSPAVDSSTDKDPRTFLQGMYGNGAKGYFDALGHHPYCFPAAPGDAHSWSPWYQMYGTPNNLRSQMVANGDGGKKIWATEFGFPTSGPSGTYVSEATQAQYITKAYELFKTYSWAGPLFIWSSRDNSTDSGTNFNFYGLIRHNFSAKPSLAAYQAAAAAG